MSSSATARKKTLHQLLFRQCIAIHGMSWVYEMDTMKLTQVHQKLFDGFHGNASNGTAPMVKDCLEGENAFENLWDKIDSDTGPKLLLKSCYTQQEDQVYTAGSSFTMVSVSATNQKTNVVVDGCAILNMAQSALKNGKKALAIKQSAYVNGKLPSGWNDDTLDKYILDGMWKADHMTVELEVDGDDTGVDDDELTAQQSTSDVSECPDGWIFSGWMVYRLFGPRAHADYQSTLFSVGDWPENKRGEKASNGGRTEARKEKAATEAATRLNSTDRGIPFGCTKKDIVNIALVEDKAEARAHESSLLAFAKVIESKQKRMANLTKMLELPGLEERHRTHILDNIMTLMNIIQDKEILMEDMYNHKRKAPSVVSELLSGATAKHAPSSAVHATVEIANAAVGNRNIAVGNRNDSGSSDSPTAF
jgi:hypothetical protein